jgi:hypothetical protein
LDVLLKLYLSLVSDLFGCNVNSVLYECCIVTVLRSKVVLCTHFKCNVALHIDTTTSANGTYEISLESTEDVPEDQMNITKGLTEAPNQSSEDINISDFGPTSKGKPWI